MWGKTPIYDEGGGRVQLITCEGMVRRLQGCYISLNKFSDSHLRGRLETSRNLSEWFDFVSISVV